MPGELAESLAAGLTTHVADVRRRFGRAEQVVVQVDEPSITAVLGGGVPTASGFGRHRTVQPPEADSLLRLVVDAIIAAGACPVVHSCATDVPVSLLAGAGFTAISFDLGLAEPDDGWSQLFEAGTDLWPGVVPSTDAEVTESDLRRRVERFFDRLGFDEDASAHRTVVIGTDSETSSRTVRSPNRLVRFSISIMWTLSVLGALPDAAPIHGRRNTGCPPADACSGCSRGAHGVVRARRTDWR